MPTSTALFQLLQGNWTTQKIVDAVNKLAKEKRFFHWGLEFPEVFENGGFSCVLGNPPWERIKLQEKEFFATKDSAIAIYNHRFASFSEAKSKYSQIETIDTDTTVATQYWTPLSEAENRLAKKDWNKKWLYGIRRVTRNTDERTIIGSVIPRTAVTYGLYLMFSPYNNLKFCSLIANFNSIVLDYFCRNALSQPSLTFGVLKQLPVIPPETYTEEDIKFIGDRVLELVYTAWDMQPFTKDMGYDGEPFIWDEQRRAILRAELDAYYAKLYGLTRDELRYILDPADVYGEDFPSETFRVLKNKEINQYGEYRTQRLVLAAWDRMFG